MKYLLIFILFNTSVLQGKILEFDKIQHSQIAISGHISSLYRSGNQLFTSPYYSDFFIRSQYIESPKAEEFPFGDKFNDTAGSERIALPDSIKRKRYWTGIAPYQEGLILLEGHRKRVISYQIPSKMFSDFKDIILDIFKPAADSRGEPTSLEVSNSRQVFSRRLKKFDDTGILLSGLVRLPKGWSPYSDESYLVATRLRGYSLFLMTCNSIDGFLCILRRQCFLEDSSFDPNKATGLGLSERRREIYRIDTRENQILVFQWKSCHHIHLLSKVPVAKKIKNPKNIMIDKDDNLWLSSEEPDNYLNASVYKWLAKDWFSN